MLFNDQGDDVQMLNEDEEINEYDFESDFKN